MSNYPAKAIDPKTGRPEDVLMIDDHFGRHKYGVEFPDGTVYHEENVTILPSDCLDEPAKDATNPDHYRAGDIECIDAIKAATTGLEGIEAVCTGNALKYLWRWKRKNGATDLKKSRWYLDRLLQELEP